jgi:hypothetical protein
MTFRGCWPKNDYGSISEGHNQVTRALDHAEFGLRPFLCERYIMEKYCNSGIAMFLIRAFQQIQLTFGTAKCSI